MHLTVWHLLIRRHENTLALEHLGQLAVLMHAHENVTPTHEFLVNVQLGDRWPIGVFLDAWSL